MKNLIKRFVVETEGQDLIEYALLAALIAIGSIIAMGTLSTAINTEFGVISAALPAAS
jgi:pilus assembly protein Flp/PilA